MRHAVTSSRILPAALSLGLALALGGCTDDDGEVFTGGPGGTESPATGQQSVGPSGPGTGEPGTGQPGTGEPGTGQPGTGEPGTGEPGTGTSAAIVPGMILSENIGDAYEGPGGEIYARSGADELGSGTLSASGELELELYGSDQLESQLEPVMVEFPDGFSMFACLPEVRDQVVPEARFVHDRALLYNSTDGEGGTIIGFLGLTSQDEGDLSISDSWPGGGETHAHWIFSTHAMTLDATCDAGFIDVTLEPGWNEVYFRDTPPNVREQWTGDRPAELGWYLDVD